MNEKELLEEIDHLNDLVRLYREEYHQAQTIIEILTNIINNNKLSSELTSYDVKKLQELLEDEDYYR